MRAGPPADLVGVGAGRLAIEDRVRVGAENTARVFGPYPRKGVRASGSDADSVIVDPELEATMDDARSIVGPGPDRQTVGSLGGTPGWGRHLPRGEA